MDNYIFIFALKSSGKVWPGICINWQNYFFKTQKNNEMRGRMPWYFDLRVQVQLSATLDKQFKLESYSMQSTQILANTNKQKLYSLILNRYWVCTQQICCELMEVIKYYVPSEAIKRQTRYLSLVQKQNEKAIERHLFIKWNTKQEIPKWTGLKHISVSLQG